MLVNSGQLGGDIGQPIGGQGGFIGSTGTGGADGSVGSSGFLGGNVGGLLSGLGGLLGGSGGGNSFDGTIGSLLGSPGSGTGGVNTTGSITTGLGGLIGLLGTIFNRGGSTTTPPFNGNPQTGQNPDGTVNTGNTGQSGTPAGTNQLLQQLTALLGGVGLPLYGAINQQNQSDWNNAAKISTLNYLQRLGGTAEQNLGVQQQYLPQMLQQMAQSGALSNATQSSLGGNLNNAISGAPGAFMGSVDPYSTVPGSQDIINWLGGIQGQNAAALGGLQSSLANGPVSQGQGTALGLASGQNPYAARLKQLSDQLTNGQPVGQPNSSTQHAMGIADSILGHNPLLSMDQIRSMAIDQNATQAQNAANKNRRDLMNRTGVTGPAIASGNLNELLGSSQDQALQNQASGVTQAVLGQQGLQNQLYNTGASLFGSAQNAGLNQQQLALQQLLGGAGLLSGNQGTQVAALNALANLGGTQNQGYNALSGLTNNMSGNTLGEGNFLESIQKLGLDKTSGLYGALGNLFGQQGNLANLAQQGMFGGANYGQNSYNQNLQFLQGLASGNVGLFGNGQAPQNFFNFGK